MATVTNVNKSKIGKWLEANGFVKSISNLFIHYIDPNSGTSGKVEDRRCLVMPKGRLRLQHVHAIRHHLDAWGLMKPDEFDMEFITITRKDRKNNKMMIEAGKTYMLRDGHTMNPRKVHVDYILDNQALIQYRDDPEYWEHMLVVYRVWHKHKKYWLHYVEPYQALCIYNDWPWTKP
jgi:hypothetical protein